MTKKAILIVLLAAAALFTALDWRPLAEHDDADTATRLLVVLVSGTLGYTVNAVRPRRTYPTVGPTRPVSLTLRAVFEPEGDGWIHAYLPALPGVITSAPSEGDARSMLADALREYLLSLDEDASADDCAHEVLTLAIS